MNTHPGNKRFPSSDGTLPPNPHADAAAAVQAQAAVGRSRAAAFRPARGRSRDIFAPLFPPGVERMPVAWETVTIPGPPASLRPHPGEEDEPGADRRRNAVVQRIPMPEDDEILAFVDQSTPRALYDVMCCDLARPPASPTAPSSTVAALSPTAQTVLWRSVLTFVELVSDLAVRRAFGLEGGRMSIAFDSGPATRDRTRGQDESPVRLHLTHWGTDELAGLRDAVPLGRIRNPRIRRRLVDPFAFLGGTILADALRDAGGDLPFRVIEPGPEPGTGDAPPAPGCHLRVDGWRSLADPAFARGMMRLHHIIEQTHAGILHAFTGRDQAPAPWQRHTLLPADEIRARLARLELLSSRSRAGLAHLAGVLRDVPAPVIRGLRRHPALLMHHLSLPGPCYTASLHSPLANHGPAGLLGVRDVRLTIQPRLLSDLGAADLVTLGEVSQVKLRRGQGTFSEEMWRRRCAFLRTFLATNTRVLGALDPRLATPIATFAGGTSGWSPAA